MTLDQINKEIGDCEKKIVDINQQISRSMQEAQNVIGQLTGRIVALRERIDEKAYDVGRPSVGLDNVGGDAGPATLRNPREIGN